jgi:omega-hydroxy-beta-dihydromenaquinone-9 sulfotransferase
VASMRAAYEALHLDEFSYCENKMKSFAERKKNFKVLNHQLPPEERKIVSEKLDPIIRHWDYPFL